MRYDSSRAEPMGKLVKIVAVVALSLIAIIAGLIFAVSSLCTVTGGGYADGRLPAALCAVVALAAMLGAVWLLRKMRDNW